MFIGQHDTTLDAKHRLALPPRYKGMLASGVYVTQGFERNLLVLTIDAFAEIAKRIRNMNMADPLARLLFRMILGSATKMDLDKNGCIIVPQNLIEFANLEQDVLLVGQGDYFELWAAQLWKEQIISLNNVEANAHRFAALNLCTG